MFFANNWQTPAAIAVVVLTLIVFAIQIVRSKRTRAGGNCGGGCNCDVKPESKN